MAYKKIFVDSDVLLDFLLDRTPFADYSEYLLNEAENNRIQLHTSTLIVANIHYIIRKKFGNTEAKSNLKSMLKIIRLLSLDALHINQGLDSNHTDFEDSIQYYIAKDNNCDLIISRNTKHYKKFNLPVLTSEQYLRTIL
ncbi:PIN domain-containing protein [Mucilaginibacter koreensis]